MQFDNSISAVVTGGASGLGEAVVRLLRRQHVNVGVFDRNESRGQALVDELGVCFAKVDVSNAESVHAGFAQVRAQHGQERILVNCAGVGTPGKTVDKEGVPLASQIFQSIININLVGSFFCASQAAAGMVTCEALADGERGVIINTASVAAYDGQIGQVAYAASKGGVVGMTLPMARDLSRNGIRVMTIAPGLFMTPMLAGLPEKAQESLGLQVPFPSRLGQPAEYAQLVAQIINNVMLNGEVIRLDGAIRMAPK